MGSKPQRKAESAAEGFGDRWRQTDRQADRLERRTVQKKQEMETERDRGSPLRSPGGAARLGATAEADGRDAVCRTQGLGGTETPGGRRKQEGRRQEAEESCFPKEKLLEPGEALSRHAPERAAPEEGQRG